MAKRKSKKKVYHRRRRISGTSALGEVLQEFIGIAAGGVGGMFLNQALKTAFTSLPTFAPGVVIGGAGVFAKKTMAKKGALIAGIAEGLMAAGGVIILNETVISVPGISGVGFVTNYDKSMKTKPAMMRAVGAPGFMDNSIGTVRDLASVGDPFIGAVYDN